MKMRQEILISAFYLLISLFVIVPSSVLAAAGDFDTAFSSPDGVLQYSCPLGTDTVLRDIVRQPDGKIIATGRTIVSGYFRMLLVRFNADGTVDSDFGLGGFALTSNGEGYGIALQQDGKILVTGRQTLAGATYIFAVWRYNSNGTPDTDFGTNGLASDKVGSTGEESGIRIVVQPDGRILAAGYCSYSSITIAIVLRYNSDGTYDSSFASGGLGTYGTYGDGTHSYYFSDIAIQSDGKLVLCGTVSTVSDSYLFVLRYNSNGTLDTGFGSSGVVTYPGPGNNTLAAAIAIQSDGKIVVGGSSGDNDVLLLRLNSNGSLDSGFGTAGAVLATDNSVRVQDIALQANGKIVVVGSTSQVVIHSAFSVWRFNSNGSLDSGFGTGGLVRYNYTDLNLFEGAHAVLIQPDGKIVVAGEVGDGPGSTGGLMRLLPQYYNISTSTIPTNGCDGFVSCSPDPVWEGGDSNCAIVPNSGCRTTGLLIDWGMLNQTLAPVWSYRFSNLGSALGIQATFAPATIWLFKNQSLQKTDSTMALAFSDTAANNYDLIKVLSGLYFDLAGMNCSDIGNVTPVLSGEWATLDSRGTNPTVIAPKLTISGTCELIIDGITIQ
ncbi:MAG: hypothetical protein C0402_08465 [Thermodesulfovibrio sp.]|nr:hypothetical protein [Thermodesulfovibrio sp.]